MTFKKISTSRSMILGLGIPIEIDAVLSESHDSTKDFTRYPVEYNLLGTNNALQQPEKLELTILVTDTPVKDETYAYEGRHRAIYSQLKLWQALSTPVVVITGLRSYINMYISKLNPVKTPNDGKSMKINLTFVEVPFVEFGLAALAASLLVDSAVSHSVTGPVNLGLI